MLSSWVKMLQVKMLQAIPLAVGPVVGIVGSVRVGSPFLTTAGSMNLQTSPPTAFVLIISSHSSQSLGFDRMTVDFWGEVIAGVDVHTASFTVASICGCQVRRRLAVSNFHRWSEITSRGTTRTRVTAKEAAWA